jgi:hypothetical protein
MPGWTRCTCTVPSTARASSADVPPRRSPPTSSAAVPASPVLLAPDSLGCRPPRPERADVSPRQPWARSRALTR